MSTELNPFESLLPKDMAKKAEDVGVYKATKQPFLSFFLAITAGVFIAIAFVFYVSVTTGGAASGAAWGSTKFIGGLAFSLGLVLVVICGGDLFTSTVLTTVARASKRITTGQLFKNWTVVYVGNFIGALLFVVVIWFAKMHLNANGQWGINAMQIAQHKLHHSFSQAVILGMLCNLMVCLGVWMTYSCRTATDKVLVVILPVAMFVASGFEHCVANMFMVPMAIAIQTFASPEFWAMTGFEPSQFADLTMSNFIVNNLIPVTIGNIIGGAFLVGMTYWIIYLRKSH